MPQRPRRSSVAKDRRPQINFQVNAAMKLLYEEAKACGHWVTRFCAAGFLLLMEKPHMRRDALNRLREWEDEYARADEGKIRTFVRTAEEKLRTSAIKGMKPPPKSRKAR